MPTPATTARPLHHWLIWAACLIALDQLAKHWIVTHFDWGQGSAITPFFNLVRAHNSGAAFSFLAGAGGWQRHLFIAIALGATALIVWQLRKHPTQGRFCLALASILGGAIGNVIDRVRYGYVVDFADFHWAGWHYPAFNIADTAIVAGAALLILDEFLRTRQSQHSPPA